MARNKINAKRKGNSFENEIAKFLTKATGVKFSRVPASGAFGTINRSTDSRFFGDVFTEDERFNDIVVECKSYKDFNFREIFSKNSKLYKWIKQCKLESRDKKWVLFFKINFSGTYMCKPSDRLCSLDYIEIEKQGTLVLNDMYEISKIN